MSDGPLIVQSDRTVLLEVAHPLAEDARHDLAVFAGLERAPEHVHTYRITRLGLWNARAAGHDADDMLGTLERYAKFPVPQTGRRRHARDRRTLRAARSSTAPTTGAAPAQHDLAVLTEVAEREAHRARCSPSASTTRASSSRPWARGALKQELVKLGWPAEDLAGYTPGTPHPIDLDQTEWHLRDYQQKAVDNFFDGGSGVVVLPCGAGKTLVGAGAMATRRPPRSSS
jgi:DNA excision repair protein ERCC-3